MDWAFEVIDNNTHKVLISDKGYSSESEAEYYANIDIKINHAENCYVRTFPNKE